MLTRIERILAPTISALSCLACIAAMVSCNTATNTDLKCGAEKKWHGFPQAIGSNLEGGIRTIIFEAKNEPEDICSEEHAKPSYSVLANNPLEKLPDDIKVIASVSIPLRVATTKQMVNDGSGKYTADLDIGLASAYAGRPAYVNMQIKFEFASRGGYSVDSAYLYQHLLLTDMYLTYREYVAGL